jgi:putative heme iron utilization protein
MHVAQLGTLATNSRKHAGWPFGSMMPYAPDDRGNAIFLVSSMAVHTQNLQQDPKASLFVAQPGVSGDPLGSPRVTVMGTVVPAGNEVRELYLKRYKNAQYWIDFDDFSLIRLEVADVYFIGGFGVMGWVSASEYQNAAPDPLADAAEQIIEHMNRDHGDTLVLLAHAFAGLAADQARLTAVDRLGFDLRLQTGDRVHGTRIAFPEEVRDVDKSRSTFVEMARQARTFV